MDRIRLMTVDELDKVSHHAAQRAVQAAFDAGLSVVGAEDGVLYLYHPDGTKTKMEQPPEKLRLFFS